MVKAEEALAVILFLIGFKGKKKDEPEKPVPPDQPDPDEQNCINIGGRWDAVSRVCFTDDDKPDLPEGCGAKPPISFQEDAGYWWQPATDNVGWNSNVRDQRPDSSVILSIHEAHSQPLENWYRCEQLGDPIRIITQFI